MSNDAQKKPVSVRVSMRLPTTTYEAMREASAHLGFDTVGRTVMWFALLGLQAAQGSAAAQRSANVSVEMLEWLKRGSEAEEKGPEGSK